jgi:hypothetical protein
MITRKTAQTRTKPGEPTNHSPIPKNAIPRHSLALSQLRSVSTACGEWTLAGENRGIPGVADWRTTGAHRLFKPQKGLSSVREAEDTPDRLGREQPWYTCRAELPLRIGDSVTSLRIPLKQEALREPGAVQHSPLEGATKPGDHTREVLIKLDPQAA